MHGYGRVVDQVARRREFEAAHPGVVITHHDDADGWYWNASWCTDHEESRELNDGELSGLLDQLAAEPEFG